MYLRSRCFVSALTVIAMTGSACHMPRSAPETSNGVSGAPASSPPPATGAAVRSGNEGQPPADSARAAAGAIALQSSRGSYIQQRVTAAFNVGVNGAAGDGKSRALFQTNIPGQRSAQQSVENAGNQGIAVQSNLGGPGNQYGFNRGNGGIAYQVNLVQATATASAQDHPWTSSSQVTVTDRGDNNQIVENQGNGGAAEQINPGAESRSGTINQTTDSGGNLNIAVTGNAQSVYLQPTMAHVNLDIRASNSQIVIGTEPGPAMPSDNRAGSSGDVNADRPGSWDNNNNNNDNENSGGNNNNNNNNNSNFGRLFPGGVSITVSGHNNQVVFGAGNGMWTEQQNDQQVASTEVVGGGRDAGGTMSASSVALTGGGNQVVFNQGNDGAAIQANGGV